MKYNPFLGDEGPVKINKKYGGKDMIRVALCLSYNAVRDLAASIQNDQLRSRAQVEEQLAHGKAEAMICSPEDWQRIVSNKDLEITKICTEKEALIQQLKVTKHALREAKSEVKMHL
jgi:hypothetical protein